MNEYLCSFLREAKRLGVEKRSLTYGRKSIKFSGVIAGKNIIYFLCSTPSDSRRGAVNAISDLRRMVRDAAGDGDASPKRVHRSLAAPRRRRPRRSPSHCDERCPPIALCAPEATRLSHDPWAPLTALRAALSRRSAGDESSKLLPPQPRSKA